MEATLNTSTMDTAEETTTAGKEKGVSDPVKSAQINSTKSEGTIIDATTHNVSPRTKTIQQISKGCAGLQELTDTLIEMMEKDGKNVPEIIIDMLKGICHTFDKLKEIEIKDGGTATQNQFKKIEELLSLYNLRKKIDTTSEGKEEGHPSDSASRTTRQKPEDMCDINAGNRVQTSAATITITADADDISRKAYEELQKRLDMTKKLLKQANDIKKKDKDALEEKLEIQKLQVRKQEEIQKKVLQAHKQEVKTLTKKVNSMKVDHETALKVKTDMIIHQQGKLHTINVDDKALKVKEQEAVANALEKEKAKWEDERNNFTKKTKDLENLLAEQKTASDAKNKKDEAVALHKMSQGHAFVLQEEKDKREQLLKKLGELQHQIKKKDAKNTAAIKAGVKAGIKNASIKEKNRYDKASQKEKAKRDRKEKALRDKLDIATNKNSAEHKKNQQKLLDLQTELKSIKATNAKNEKDRHKKSTAKDNGKDKDGNKDNENEATKKNNSNVTSKVIAVADTTQLEKNIKILKNAINNDEITGDIEIAFRKLNNQCSRSGSTEVKELNDCMKIVTKGISRCLSIVVEKVGTGTSKIQKCLEILNDDNPGEVVEFYGSLTGNVLNKFEKKLMSIVGKGGSARMLVWARCNVGFFLTNHIRVVLDKNGDYLRLDYAEFVNKNTKKKLHFDKQHLEVGETSTILFDYLINKRFNNSRILSKKGEAEIKLMKVKQLKKRIVGLMSRSEWGDVTKDQKEDPAWMLKKCIELCDVNYVDHFQRLIYGGGGNHNQLTSWNNAEPIWTVIRGKSSRYGKERPEDRKVAWNTFVHFYNLHWKHVSNPPPVNYYLSSATTLSFAWDETEKETSKETKEEKNEKTATKEETTTKTLSNELIVFLNESRIKVTTKLIFVFDEIGIEKLLDFDDLDEELTKRLECPMKPIEKRRFRTQLVAIK